MIGSRVSEICDVRYATLTRQRSGEAHGRGLTSSLLPLRNYKYIIVADRLTFRTRKRRIVNCLYHAVEGGLLANFTDY